MSDDLFRTVRSNLLPFGVSYDSETRTSTIIDRLYRPIITCAGKFPRCDLALATVADGAPLYGVKPIATFFRVDGAPHADPAVRRRLRELVNGCGVLRDELRKRARMENADPPPQPTATQAHAELIAHTFGEAIEAA
jgi:hypothetical protein